MIALAQLNTLDRERFADAVGWIFEASPWVADASWPRRPFASVDALHAAMVAAVAAAPRAQQLALLRAHPDLGTRSRMSDASVGEQAGAGLDRLSPDDRSRLERLNDAYRAKFGFPFLFAVRGSTRQDILAALERRLLSSPEDELAEALQQVYRIAAFRLHDLIGTTT